MPSISPKTISFLFIFLVMHSNQISRYKIPYPSCANLVMINDDTTVLAGKTNSNTNQFFKFSTDYSTLNPIATINSGSLALLRGSWSKNRFFKTPTGYITTTLTHIELNPAYTINSQVNVPLPSGHTKLRLIDCSEVSEYCLYGSRGASGHSLNQLENTNTVSKRWMIAESFLTVKFKDESMIVIISYPDLVTIDSTIDPANSSFKIASF